MKRNAKLLIGKGAFIELQCYDPSVNMQGLESLTLRDSTIDNNIDSGTDFYFRFSRNIQWVFTSKGIKLI